MRGQLTYHQSAFVELAGAKLSALINQLYQESMKNRKRLNKTQTTNNQMFK